MRPLGGKFCVVLSFLSLEDSFHVAIVVRFGFFLPFVDSLYLGGVLVVSKLG